MNAKLLSVLLGYPDDELVRARRALVDQLRVAVRVGMTFDPTLHFGKYCMFNPGRGRP